MVADQIRENKHRRPFRPFFLQMDDGRCIPVVHHEWFMVSPLGRQVVVFQPDSLHDILDVTRIVGVSFEPQSQAT
jgi:hypothetical protein